MPLISAAAFPTAGHQHHYHLAAKTVLLTAKAYAYAYGLPGRVVAGNWERPRAVSGDLSICQLQAAETEQPPLQTRQSTGVLMDPGGAHTCCLIFSSAQNSGLFSHFLLLGERGRNSTDRLGHCIPKGERSRGSCHGREYRPHMMFSVRAAEVVAPVSFNNGLITVCEVWPDSVTARSVFTRW